MNSMHADSDFDCPTCGEGVYNVIGEEGSIRFYRCDKCGGEISVRIHYVEEKIPLETKVFKALVEVNDPSLVVKLRIKVKRVFGGRSNFYQDDLDRQINEGLKSWDLGYYASEEVEELSSKAQELGLIIKFIQTS